MHKIPPLNAREVVRILENHGFIFIIRAKGSHRIYYNKELGRRVTIPVHAGDLPRGTLLEILRQAGISRDELT